MLNAWFVCDVLQSQHAAAPHVMMAQFHGSCNETSEFTNEALSNSMFLAWEPHKHSRNMQTPHTHRARMGQQTYSHWGLRQAWYSLNLGTSLGTAFSFTQYFQARMELLLNPHRQNKPHTYKQVCIIKMIYLATNQNQLQLKCHQSSLVPSAPLICIKLLSNH